MADDKDPLSASRRLDSATKVARVRAAIDAIAACGDAVTVTGLARHARVSRRFIYDHPELRAEAEAQMARVAQRDGAALAATARVTTSSLRADLANTRAANQRLHTELAALRRRLGRLIGKEVLAEVAGDETAEIGAVLAPRVEHLEHTLFEVQEALAQRTEELEAARQINRELIERLNRRPSS